MPIRILRALAVSVLVSLAPLTAQAQRSGSFDITGTAAVITGQTIQFLTSDFSGRPEIVIVDASQIRVSNISTGDSLTLTVAAKSNGMYEAWVIVSQGSRTQENDFGARAEFETRNDSAEVFNRADDDEARAKDKDRRGKED
ncbi:MAG: hypothetical protein ACKVVP_11370 [Chloroflexota bacterium]